MGKKGSWTNQGWNMIFSHKNFGCCLIGHLYIWNTGEEFTKTALFQCLLNTKMLARMNSWFVLSQDGSSPEKMEKIFQELKHIFLLWSLKAHLDLRIVGPWNKNIHDNLLWCLLLCILKECLDLKVFWQRSQGRTIPSMWFASMWSFIAFPLPSFPHTLHLSALWLWFWHLLSLFSIIDLTISSSWCTSPQ